jgi:hypothetical protein
VTIVVEAFQHTGETVPILPVIAAWGEKASTGRVETFSERIIIFYAEVVPVTEGAFPFASCANGNGVVFEEPLRDGTSMSCGSGRAGRHGWDPLHWERVVVASRSARIYASRNPGQ